MEPTGSADDEPAAGEQEEEERSQDVVLISLPSQPLSPSVPQASVPQSLSPSVPNSTLQLSLTLGSWAALPLRLRNPLDAHSTAFVEDFKRVRRADSQPLSAPAPQPLSPTLRRPNQPEAQS